MNKKHIKLIMELIFIFILPLLFICFTSKIQIEREFAYDNNGNYETSQETKNLSFDNSIIKYIHENQYINYLHYNQSVVNYNFVNDSNWYETGFNSTNYNNGFIFTTSGDNTPTRIYTVLKTTLNHKYLALIQFENVDNSEKDYYYYRWPTYSSSIQLSNNIEGTFFTPTSSNESIYFGIQFDNNVVIDATLKYINLIDLTEMYGSGYEPSTLNDYLLYNNLEFTSNIDITKRIESNSIISSDYIINYTIWGNIKQLLVENLELNDNVLLDIILCYTILWVIMWIIWHVFYGFFELIWHILPRKE